MTLYNDLVEGARCEPFYAEEYELVSVIQIR